MGRIRSLPIWLVNQIAAGEVIERPASVVKELLENSIDAGANHIDVALEDGGKRLVRVSDDGVGIAADDLPLAVASHASSKIATQDDLVAIRTLGFRGEALASIAAVAAVRLVSRPHEQLAGAEIEVVAGRAEPVRAVAAPTGTTVEVRNLFFNVPARRKFLRNASTELAHVSEQLARIALPRPGVAFSLTQNGRSIRQLPPAADARERIAAIYGPELAEALLAIDRQERATRISGWIGKPAQTRLTSRWQYFFVNGRYVRDRFLAHAVREAYRGLIEPTRFAPVFLFIEIEPSAIDVNVHPTKIELRWRDSNLIHSQVLSVLREALRESNLTVALRTAEGGSDEVARQERIRQAIADFFKQQRPIQRSIVFEPHDGLAAGGRSAGPPASMPPPRPFEPAVGPAEATPPHQGPVQPPATQDTAVKPAGQEPIKAVQLHKTYLVAETPDGIIIVDQHALHERVLYEQFRRRLAEGPLPSQRLLMPITLSATPEQLEALQANAELLQRLGIEISPFGPSSLAVQACPALLGELDVGELMRDLLDRLVERLGQANSESLMQETLQLMACKAAVKAGQALSQQEIDVLLAHREQVERSSNCPHGRPTTLRLSVHELERQFKRS